MKVLALISILSIGLFAKCLSPEFPKVITDKDIATSIKEAQKGIPVKLHGDNDFIYKGTAKGSLASSSFTILLNKECDKYGKCYNIKGFVSDGEISALKANVNLKAFTMTIPKGTKFEIVKGDDERWNHAGPMPKCNESEDSNKSINQKIIDSQMNPMNDAIKKGDL